ncbi:MAG: response regulator transcription factor [Chloroflexi bacterium]|nr:response regulator transcription factor [Chloroflexota bacterium]
MNSTPIQVLIVDDHPVVRRGTRALLTEVEDMYVVGEARDGLEAIEQVERLRPNVVLIDLVMPKMDGIEAIRQISSQYPELHVLVLTSFVTDDKVFPSFKAGATGYLLKDADPEDLIKAIREVHRGEASLHPSIALKLLNALNGVATSYPPAEPLTERELEVLRLLATGLENEGIALQLGIAEVTVRTHISHILAKLQFTNRIQATLYALKEGLVSLEACL